MRLTEDSPEGLPRVKSLGIPEVKHPPADELEIPAPSDASAPADAKGDGTWWPYAAPSFLLSVADLVREVASCSVLYARINNLLKVESVPVHEYDLFFIYSQGTESLTSRETQTCLVMIAASGTTMSWRKKSHRMTNLIKKLSGTNSSKKLLWKARMLTAISDSDAFEVRVQSAILACFFFIRTSYSNRTVCADLYIEAGCVVSRALQLCSYQ